MQQVQRWAWQLEGIFLPREGRIILETLTRSAPGRRTSELPGAFLFSTEKEMALENGHFVGRVLLRLSDDDVDT
uniref:Uncharacterized protein n=1 Tax=Chromera velia CCMP2878 TaxID=1169474 RepID=A0A0G4HXH3_9ALVE|eukprot:Cvel_1494.t1-p1 / transcript=Cvel_1494.t1 / gene=Cvel_1494 / organism=Chromera_velia_CCMP2878 / gene_product=hypothetical protein / transcript_product=hypothetical protein / location=Cvel_scaffold52:89261-90083(+) / protein_length=73 / sequence_SO=supercontig / SO=protein_coding / is_pseudo=false